MRKIPLFPLYSKEHAAFFVREDVIAPNYTVYPSGDPFLRSSHLTSMFTVERIIPLKELINIRRPWTALDNINFDTLALKQVAFVISDGDRQSVIYLDNLDKHAGSCPRKPRADDPEHKRFLYMNCRAISSDQFKISDWRGETSLLGESTISFEIGIVIDTKASIAGCFTLKAKCTNGNIKVSILGYSFSMEYENYDRFFDRKHFMLPN